MAASYCRLSGKVAVGLNGYYYAQVTDNKGSFSDAILVGSKGFGGSGWTLELGPALIWTPKIAANDVTLTARCVHKFEAIMRFDSDVVVMSFAFKF